MKLDLYDFVSVAVLLHDSRCIYEAGMKKCPDRFEVNPVAVNRNDYLQTGTNMNQIFFVNYVNTNYF